MLQKFKNVGINDDRLSFVWLDPSIEISNDHIQAKIQLKSTSKSFTTFSDLNQCEKYIRSYHRHYELVLIVTGQLGQELIPKIHDLEHVKGIFVQLQDLIAAIESNGEKTNNRLDEPLSIIVDDQQVMDNDADHRSTSGIAGDFLFSQLVLSVLLKTYQSMDAANELVAHCKRECKRKTKHRPILNRYKKSYSPFHALWWYTAESCLYELLNAALRNQNIDAIFVFRFFIRDLYNELSKNRCSQIERVYRGQRISNNELEIFKESTGKLISFRSFLSTSRNREIGLKFAYTGDRSLTPVLFEIEADPRCTITKPFANIEKFSCYKAEAEILFMCGSIFRLLDVQQKSDGLCIVRLRLCSDDDNELRKLYEYMHRQNTSCDSILAFGNLLYQMGKFDYAEKYYTLGQQKIPLNNINIVYYYHGLGLVRKEKGDYEESFKYLQKSLELFMRMGNHNAIASIHNDIASLYNKIGHYEKALDSYRMALEIYRMQNKGNSHEIAICYNNIGTFYYEQKKFSEALQNYQKSLRILEKILPGDHSQLGGSYHNIGDVHLNLGHYIYAFEYYNLALTIKIKSLPVNHPNIAAIYQSIGRAHECSGDLKQALLYYQKAETIYNHCYSIQHPRVKDIKEHILRITKVTSQDDLT